jgi:aspartate aminotransferase
MKANTDLDLLRSEMRRITTDIIRMVHRRMQLSKRIGEIKARFNIEVTDEGAEEDIRRSVTSLSSLIGMDPDSASKLLNILLIESVRVQEEQQPNNRQTHLGIFTKAKEMEATGKKIIHMEVGEPDFPPPRAVRDAMVRAYNSGHYHYTETAGISKLRQGIAKAIGYNTAERNIFVTPGARFGVFATIMSLVRPGDEVILIEPAWPAYRECTDFVGAKSRILRTNLAQNWTPDMQSLEALVTNNTKMIIINSPNNPTGKVLDGKTLEKVVGLAKDHNMYVLSDEVYSAYVYSQFSSILQHEYDKKIFLSSFSKSHAMTGFRVGFVISSKDILTKIGRVQALAMTSVSEPMQYSALAALREDNSHNVTKIKSRLDLIMDTLRLYSVPFYRPDGGLYVFPKINGDFTGRDLDLVERLLGAGVAIAPGSGFGESYYGFIRISACQPSKALLRGLSILINALSSR